MSVTPKHKIINDIIGGVHSLALVQYDFGASKAGRARAWVTYISYHWDDLFPPSYTLPKLREMVLEFCEENGLKIEMEQTSDNRFYYKLHGHDHINAKLNSEGRITDLHGNFISSVQKYRG